jgi:hypothetical protein
MRLTYLLQFTIADCVLDPCILCYKVCCSIADLLKIKAV